MNRLFYKLGVGLISVVLLGAIAASPVLADDQQPIIITVNGQQLQSDVSPQIINGRTMVPLRAISEALGATVQYTPSTGIILVSKGSTVFSVVNDDPHAVINYSTDVPLDVPPQIINGRALVPLRFFSETLGFTANWNAATQTVDITTSNDNSTNTSNTTSSTNAQTTTPAANSSVLTPPTNLQATPESDALIELTWDAVTGATSYEILLQNGSYDKSIDTTNTTYDCSGLINGTTYNFKVKSLSGSQESDYSQSVSATTISDQQVQQQPPNTYIGSINSNPSNIQQPSSTNNSSTNGNEQEIETLENEISQDESQGPVGYWPDANSYNSDLQALQNERQQYQDQLNALTLDNSSFATNQKYELQQEINQLTQQITAMQGERSRQLEIQSLQNMLNGLL